MQGHPTSSSDYFSSADDVSAAGDDLSSGLSGTTKALAEHAEALLKATTSLSGDSIANLRKQLTETLGKAREQATKAETFARERGKQALEDSQEYVRQKPLQTVAIAVLAGLVLGVLAASGRRD